MQTYTQRRKIPVISPVYNKPIFDITVLSTFDLPDDPQFRLVVVFSNGLKNCKNSLPYAGAQTLEGAQLPQSVIFPQEGTENILFGNSYPVLYVAVGENEPFPVSYVRELGGRVGRAILNSTYEQATLLWEDILYRPDVIPPLKSPSDDVPLSGMALFEFVRGLQTVTYRFDDLKTISSKKKIPSITLVAHCFKLVEEAIERANIVTLAEHYSRRLIDLPSQRTYMSTCDLTNESFRLTSDISERASTTVIRGSQLQDVGLNALYAVGKGSMNPPALALMHWKGAPSNTRSIALVGKGIVFDTGGENVKSAESMKYMKADMGGSAMALAAFSLVTHFQIPVNLTVALAIAENAISGHAYHMSDVYQLFNNGPTIEVGHTDAEGRIVLADALRYVECHYCPSALVTVATLTGASHVALGRDFGCLFTSTDMMMRACMDSANESGNKLWPLPLEEAKFTNFDEGLAGTLADMCTTGGDGGGAIVAAKFLRACADTKHYAHMDVSNVAKKGRDLTGHPAEFSTGYGPYLLFLVIKNMWKELDIEKT